MVEVGARAIGARVLRAEDPRILTGCGRSATSTPRSPRPIGSSPRASGCIGTSRLALLRENPSPDEAEVREVLSGDVCRCTGYQSIVESVHLAAERGAGQVAAASEGGVTTTRA
jgi:hypothetical protein